jgi:chloramphenicol-sensitive protein RarD
MTATSDFESWKQMNKGVLYGAFAYMMWGFFPIYFKSIHGVPALQVTAHRVSWSFILLAVILLIRREWGEFRQDASSRRTVLIYLVAAVMLAVNWLLYVWGVSAGFVIETSLGYFINPLVNVLLGTLFLHEKLRPAQWIPVGLAAVGVIYLTVTYGSLPWIALGLALSFGFYGLFKKIAPLNSLHGLSMETAILFLPAAGYLIFAEVQGSGAFGHVSGVTSLLLALTGVVTTIPLLLFASGARRIPLTTLGLLQYIAPTLQFLSGVLLYHEAFTPARMVGFGLIWLALIIYTVESFLSYRRTVTAAQPANP